jgi:hypothetical protein
MSGMVSSVSHVSSVSNVRPVFAGFLYLSAAMLVLAGVLSLWVGFQGI